MKRLIRITFLLSFGLMLFSCTDLNVNPQSIISEEDVFSSESGVRAYMARLYSMAPMEDLKFNHLWGFHDWWIFKHPANMTAMSASRDASGVDAINGYWDAGYDLMRQINNFINGVKKYRERYPEKNVDKWLGEAHFLRAYTYFALVKRYGGVPLITKVLQYPENTIEELQRPRAPEEKIYTFINNELSKAAKMLPASNVKGRVDKWAAYAFKARVNLYAGSLAMYNEIKLTDSEGNKIIGLPENKAEEYFRMALEATGKLKGHFGLYKERFNESKMKNFQYLFLDETSRENIWVKYYTIPEDVHGYDVYNLPPTMTTSYGSGLCPTVNFVRLFSGIPKNEDGTLNVLDESGEYILYDKMSGFFKNASPRLKATIVWPGASFKNKSKIDIRRGIYTGPVQRGIAALIPKGYRGAYPTENLVTSSNRSQQLYTLPNGEKMLPAGKSGIFTAFTFQCATGFYVRKYIVPDKPRSEVKEQNSFQHFILLRYAEQLLIRAEAALLLHKLGASGANYMNIALTAVNKVRTRAGVPEFTPAELTVEKIRKERIRELGFENRYWWDLMRTRVAVDRLDGLTPKAFHPFYAAKAGKYFYEVTYIPNNGQWDFPKAWYYLQVPSSVLDSNPKIIQNPIN